MKPSSRLGAPPSKPRAAFRHVHCLPRREISGLELVDMPEFAVWDVRPYPERTSGPGYIPGSRSVPITTQEAMGLPWNKIVEGSACVVLVCLSGRRSGNIAAELWAAGQERVLQLRGGILEWQANGLSLCVPEAPEPSDWAQVVSLEDFRREATACFVAESVLLHAMSPEGDFVSPKLLIERVLAQPAAMASFDAALATLDLLAENLRRLGHPVERLGVNLSSMRSVLQRLNEGGQFNHGWS